MLKKLPAAAAADDADDDEVTLDETEEPRACGVEKRRLRRSDDGRLAVGETLRLGVRETLREPPLVVVGEKLRC